MDIKLNSNLAWSAIGNPGPTQYDVQNVTTHEAGHFLVLLDLYGEEYDYAKTMYGYGSAGEISKRDLEPEDIAGINYIYPAFTLGTAGSDVLWAGVIGVTGNATIPSGRTLTVLPGTRVTFPANVSLTISGTLKADGTSSERITLDRSGTSNWYGTRFTSTASSSSYLKNSTLSYASYAVRIEGSSPLIQDCTISDNDYSIYITGSGAYPIIERCYVAGTYPLYAVNSCDPEITNSKLKSVILIPAQFYSGADGTLTRCSFSTISGNNCLLYTSGAGTSPWVGGWQL